MVASTWYRCVSVSVLVGVLVAVTFAPALQAADGGYVALKTNGYQDTWATDTVQVVTTRPLERLVRAGSTLVGVQMSSTCMTVDCKTRDLSLFVQGTVAMIANVDRDAVDERRLLLNNGRILWAEQSEHSAVRFHIMEVDPATGTRVKRFSDLFLGNVVDVDVFARGDRYYIEADRTPVRSSDRPQTDIYMAFSKGGQSFVLNQQWRHGYEEIQDVREDGRILTRVTFDNGDQELWVHELNHASYAIPESYTIDGYLVAAQFVGNDVEFFRYQKLMRFDRASGVTSTLEERLQWAPTLQEQLDLVVWDDGTLFFVMDDATLRQSVVMRRKAGVTSLAGSFEDKKLHLVGDDVQFLRAETYTNGLDIFDLPSGIHLGEQAGLRSHDAFAGSTAGVTQTGEVVWRQADKGLLIGREAVSALLADALHVYWTDASGLLYATTVKPTVWLARGGEQFVTTPNSRTVYMIDGSRRYTVMNEQVYRTWREDFDGVRTMDVVQLGSYKDGGPAPMAPGTMIRTATNPAVYVILDAWTAAPLLSADKAHALYGHGWWSEVRFVDQAIMERYLLNPQTTVEAL